MKVKTIRSESDRGHQGGHVQVRAVTGSEPNRVSQRARLEMGGDHINVHQARFSCILKEIMVLLLFLKCCNFVIDHDG